MFGEQVPALSMTRIPGLRGGLLSEALLAGRYHQPHAHLKQRDAGANGCCAEVARAGALSRQASQKYS